MSNRSPVDDSLRPTAAVVGGGIAGLSAAYELQLAGVEVSVYEASDRWGGKILTSRVGTEMVDAGPDTFLARASEGVELCTELGLADELVAPIAPVPAYIHRDGKLAQLPSGTILGIPTDLDAVAASGLVSAAGIDRAKQDAVLPQTTYVEDCSLGWYCRQRLGDELTMRLVDPLLGGVNASDIDHLSLEAAFPALAKIAKASPSLLEGLREHRKSIGPTLGSATSTDEADQAPPAPVFYSLAGGMARLSDRLVERLQAPTDHSLTPARLHLDTPIRSMEELDAQMAILTCPAPVASRLLATSNGEASRQLATVDYTSLAQVTFVFASDATDPILDASGILFPKVDGLVATAATWLSTKWAHYDSEERVIIRVTSGRSDDTRSFDMTDEQLTNELLSDLSTVIDISQAPKAVRVHRWTNSLPAYTPGHATRMNNARTALAEMTNPSVAIAGAAYDGIGLPACIRSGRQAAQKLLQAV